MSAESERELSATDALPALTRATVHAGEHATEYVRAGCGAPVLLLADRGDRSPLAPLATRFRVIAPEPPCHTRAPEPPFAPWLRDFLDGLGVARVHVVAADPYALRALRFCVTDSTRVGRVALLFRDAPDPSVVGDASPERLGHSGLPLLVCRESDDATAELLTFLSRGDA